MTATPAASLDLRTSASRFVKELLIWVPIVVGIVHQFLMFISRDARPPDVPVDRIYVVLDPPGYIYPFVTLELAWWIALTLVSSVLCLLIRAHLLRPHRLIYPFYIYLLFLLIFVKPIWPF